MAAVDQLRQDIQQAFSFLDALGFVLVEMRIFPNNGGAAFVYQSPEVTLEIMLDNQGRLDARFSRHAASAPRSLLDLRSFTDLLPDDDLPPPVKVADEDRRRALDLLAHLVQTYGKDALSGCDEAYRRAQSKQEPA